MESNESWLEKRINAFGLTHLTVDGFRAFRSVSLSPGKLNVFVGVNGCGKTSLLRAMAFVLEDVTRRIGPRTMPGQRPAASDFRDGEHYCLIEADIYAVQEKREVYRAWAVTDRQVSLRRSAEAIQGTKKLASVYWYDLEHEQEMELPLLCFYPVERAVDEVPLRIRARESYSRRSGYDRAFTAQRNFRSFFQWFREQEDAENEGRIIKPSYRDRSLEAVRTAVERALPGYSNLRISRKPRLRMLIDKGEDTLSIQQLSDGERGIVTLVGDLAKRAALLNPRLPDPLQCSGCVLIDEVDLHLHPQWQRHLVEQLPVLFPNVQFMFTTHSPIICSSVSPQNLWILSGGNIENASVYGWAVEDVLRTVFEISDRPKAVSEQLALLDTALDSRDRLVAREQLTALRAILPANDREILRAELVLSFLEESDEND